MNYCGLYSGIEFPATGYEAGDWVLLNLLACGKIVAGNPHWVEIGTYRNGYGYESLYTYFQYPGRTGDPWNWHTLDRTRHIIDTPEGPLVYLLLHRTSVINTSGIWAAYVWDWVLNVWVELREEYIPELNEGDVRANFEFHPLVVGMEYPLLPKIDWTDLQRCAPDGWLHWTPISVPDTLFLISDVYDWGVIYDHYRWWAGGNKPLETDPEEKEIPAIPVGKVKLSMIPRKDIVKPLRKKDLVEPEKLKIVKTELIPGLVGMRPRPITAIDKKIEIENPYL